MMVSSALPWSTRLGDVLLLTNALVEVDFEGSVPL